MTLKISSAVRISAVSIACISSGSTVIVLVPIKFRAKADSQANSLSSLETAFAMTGSASKAEVGHAFARE